MVDGFRSREESSARTLNQRMIQLNAQVLGFDQHPHDYPLHVQTQEGPDLKR